jgi:hypothetical protein
MVMVTELTTVPVSSVLDQVVAQVPSNAAFGLAASLRDVAAQSNVIKRNAAVFIISYF